MEDKKEREAYSRNLAADAKAALAAKREPVREDLEAVLEANEKCPTCGGGIRAICDEMEPTDKTSGYDYDIKTTLFCRNAACGWQTMQYRPWNSIKPKEI